MYSALNCNDFTLLFTLGISWKQNPRLHPYFKLLESVNPNASLFVLSFLKTKLRL